MNKLMILNYPSNMKLTKMVSTESLYAVASMYNVFELAKLKKKQGRLTKVNLQLLNTT